MRMAKRIFQVSVCILFGMGFMFLSLQCKKQQAPPVNAPAQNVMQNAETTKQAAVPTAVATGTQPAAAEQAAAQQPETAAATGSQNLPPLAGDGMVANIPMVPHNTEAEFVKYMMEKRGDNENYLKLKYDRLQVMLKNKDIIGDRVINAFLLNPREKFCRKWNLPRVYDHAFLDIGYGVTISGPHLVSRMTTSLDVQPTDKVLEIGTGSGYQSAYLSYLTDHVYTIEIIDELSKKTTALYDAYKVAGFPEFAKIKTKAADGYYGWKEYAPFDKIIVTCGIDHIPPDLLKQLKIGGIMVIPVGPPGAQIVLKVTKTRDKDGNIVVTREDIYHGRKKVPFVPFTKTGGGTHNGDK
jgi:protein-L-isoaspartate(D-aspartate) O-methyltransferase